MTRAPGDIAKLFAYSRWASELTLASVAELDAKQFVQPVGGSFGSAKRSITPKGAAVVDSRGEPAGRVTSSRWSPRLGRPIGIAWVKADRAEEGPEFAISSPSGSLIPAIVTHRAFHDPDGERLRS